MYSICIRMYIYLYIFSPVKRRGVWIPGKCRDHKTQTPPTPGGVVEVGYDGGAGGGRTWRLVVADV